MEKCSPTKKKPPGCGRWRTRCHLQGVLAGGHDQRLRETQRVHASRLRSRVSPRLADRFRRIQQIAFSRWRVGRASWSSFGRGAVARRETSVKVRVRSRLGRVPAISGTRIACHAWRRETRLGTYHGSERRRRAPFQPPVKGGVAR